MMSDVRDGLQSGHSKNTISSPCQYLGTVGSLLQICSQVLQDDARPHKANLWSRRTARRPVITALHCCAHLCWCQQHAHWNLNMLGTLCSAMSPEQDLSSLEAISLQRDIEMRFCSQQQSHISTVWDLQDDNGDYLQNWEWRGCNWLT